MPLYHFSVKIISRANGQSACAASAYCSAGKIQNEYDGRSHDYSKKQNVSFSVVMLPDNAPVDFADRAVLWNAVEQNEKQANAQLARAIEFALPVELPDSTRQQIALEFIQENFVDKGMCADVNFHNPPKMDSHKRPVDASGNVTTDPEKFVYSNPHAHVMVTLRPLDEAGKWEAKKQKLYVCEKDGRQRLFTSTELKQQEGWEKLYNYKSLDGQKTWHTKSYAEEHPDECMEQVNRYPRCEQRLNPKVEKWNSPETLLEWRAAWSDKINHALAEQGIDERVDHRSYKDRGLDLIPTVHEGKAVTIEEKHLKEEYERKIAAGEHAVQQHTDIRNLNNAIRLHNEEVRLIADLNKLKEQMKELLKPVILRVENLGKSVAERLESLRISIIDATLKIRKSVDMLAVLKEKVEAHRQYIKALKPVSKLRLKELESELQIIENKLHSVNKLFQKNKYDELQQKQDNLQAQIELYKENLQLANTATRAMNQLAKRSDELSESIAKDDAQKLEMIQEYQKTMKAIPLYEQESVDKHRKVIRSQMEDAQDRSEDFVIVAESVDKQLGIENNSRYFEQNNGMGFHL